ncbi:putative guanylate kinase [Selenomonas ruminantium subsp. lactilytica TAM6421]|uniref:Guanylate kinase n=1 Tax=Selenomonas ruminantium subsp. lactilytica (strain NBRC 103574 / TAM6421) TaxID=927704 RepID=I0GR94_SELRL|nr:guanylate kinase [Selenomonas ruminantium]BAL83281.1 putative guanylate kinase [Selenomonas ruminantium subsp. lactilytica TAM6421]
MNKGLLIVVSGPSGTGKGTVCSELLNQAQDLAYSISATTRQPRAGEVDGKNYYFMDKADFEKRIAEGGFLEYANVYGNYYGTPLAKIEERLGKGEDILLEIDTQGALNVMEKCPDGLFIFLVPPSIAELERRIRGRGSETEESLRKRMGSARKEIEDGRKYGYVVVNDTVKNAVNRILAIRTAEHCRVDKNQNIFEELAD